MSNPNETVEPKMTTLSRLRGWVKDVWIKSGGPASVTYRWLIASVFVGFTFVGCAIYAAVQSYQTDNRLTRERVAESITQQVVTCMTSNDRRAEAKDVATADVEEDRRIWEAIDALFDTGIPEPARTVIFTGLEVRQNKIEETYDPVDCSTLG
jgi:hypothetical protein